MASTTLSPPPLLHTVTSLNRARTQNVSRSITSVRCTAQSPDPIIPSRRQLLLATSAAIIATSNSPSFAADIPLFGLRKKLRDAEEEAVEIVKEGFETAEKGIENAEKGIKAAEEGIENAEIEIESAVKISGVVQAGAVAGAELVGVLIASAIVNGILGPEPQKS